MSDLDTGNESMAVKFFTEQDGHNDFKHVRACVDEGLDLVFDGALLYLVQETSSCGAIENISLYRTKAGAYICSVNTEKRVGELTHSLRNAMVIETVKDLTSFLRPHFRVAKKLYAQLPAELCIEFEERVA